MKPSLNFTLLSATIICAPFLPGCSQSRPIEELPAATLTVRGDEISFPTNAPQLEQITIEAARLQKVTTAELSGRLAWDDDVTSRVFPSVSGRVVQIMANPGQKISAGEVLAKIQSPDYGQVQGDARKTVADLKQAERALGRAKELLAHGVAAEKDLEAAEDDYAHAVSDKERAFSTLSLYGGDPNRTEVDGVFFLKAPVAGVAVDKSVSPGQEVRSDQVSEKPLFVISDPDHLWLYLDVSEADAASLITGEEVTIRTRSLPDKSFPARLEIIGEGLDPATRTLKVRCVVDNSERLLRAEMYVSADIVSTTPALNIPTQAVFLKDNSPCVFVETAPGQFRRRTVKLGLESGGRSLVTEGVSVGQRVVAEGSLLLEAILEGASS